MASVVAAAAGSVVVVAAVRLLAVLVIALTLLAASASARPATHVVQKGDTLTSIAKSYKLKISQLRRWNGLKGDSIQPGDELHLRPNSATRDYTVRKGDTLARIAKREAIDVEDILDVNPGLDARSLKIGQVISLPGGMVERDDDKPKRRARRARKERDSACPGRIVQLSKHPYYRLKSSNARWATERTATALRRAFDQVRTRHKLAPAVHVHDASSKEGGPLGDHRSHQDGRDVDIAYYQKRCPKTGCPVRVVKPSELDVRRQWTLISYWLRRGDVEALFIDHKLQKVLYEHAKKKGVSSKQLREWFEYPNPPGTRGAIIRHWDSHRNHLHVRFKPGSCPDGCCDAG